MSWVLPFLVIAISCLVLVPSVVVLVEIALGSRARPEKFTPPNLARSRTAILVPAHNEEAGISKTLSSLKRELGPDDFILVVADNCSDGTADIARKLGAKVTERVNLEKRGKGFALAHGLSALANDPPDSVIIIDADCVVTPGSIAALKAKVLIEQRPIQILNLMRSPTGHEQRFAVAEFAWRVKNFLRPSGLARLGLPCQLMGTGMAFPWQLARDTNFASANIVEDLEMGIRMARQGIAPLFFTGAQVLSEFPISREGEISQRRRWEGGSFAMLLKQGLGTVLRGVFSGNANLAALGFDMLVPPLVLHALTILLWLVVTGILVFSGLVPGIAFTLALTGFSCFALGLVLAWWSQGRDLLPVSMWITFVPFLLAKFRIHKRPVSQKSDDWVRADRNKD